jgi:SWI/SNF-related matrix-associated actin-dependent regulator 1 of chromatin subfamily A
MPTALLTILLTLVNGKLRAHIPQRLDDKAFKTFRDATYQAGFKYDRTARANDGAISAAADLAGKLGTNFRVQLTPEAHDAAIAYVDANRPTDDLAAVLKDIEPAGLIPRDYQLTGVDYLAGRTRALLHDDMGLGKTIQVLLAFPRKARAIIVCPKQVKGNWRKECRTWRPDLTPEVLEGRDSFRWSDDGEVLITNYDILADKTAVCPEGVIIVADEAHKTKTAKVKRTKRFRAAAKKVRDAGGKAWLLTGTPVLNRPGELWTVLQGVGLGHEAFGNYDNFLRMFNGRRGVYGIEWGPLGDEDGYTDDDVFVKCRDEAVEALASVALGRRKVDVAKELPSKVFQELSIDVAGKGLTAMNAFAKLADKQGFRFVGDSVLDKNGNEVTLAQLTGNKLIFEAISSMRAAVASAKIPALLSLVEDYEENEEALVVFSAHRGPVDELGKRDGWATITGAQSAEKKTAIVEAFQAGELKGVACTNAAIEGITLTAASHMIFVDRFWTPGLNNQAQDRIHRIGQDRTCFYTDLVADHPVDRLVLDLLRVKEAHLETITAATKQAAPESPFERLRAFLATADIIAAPAVEIEAPVTDDSTEGVSEYAPLVTHLTFAKSHLKYPKLRMEDDEGNTVVIGVLGDRSRTPGQLKVTSAGSFESAAFFGRIDTDGCADSRLKAAPAFVHAILDTFCANPAAAARLYGQRTGTCCCCGAELTNARSIELGIGPICRGHWDL